MNKKLVSLCVPAVAVGLTLSLTACSSDNSSSSSTSTSAAAASSASSMAAASSAASSGTAIAATLGQVSNSFAEDSASLISSTTGKFTQEEYQDAESGKSITYNIFLPANYDPSKTYPMVVFIADASTVGTDPTVPLTQGIGANVWTSDAFQQAYPSIVLVPSYPEVILDDNSGGHVTTDYVEATPRLIDSVSQKYSVDKNRIYGTGQSMGAMTSLLLASEHPDLYAGIMPVDGQWDISTLKGLESQNMIYFGAEDDDKAWAGMQEVMDMFKSDGVSHSYAQWDGTWTPDQRSEAAQQLFSQGNRLNLVSWKAGTVDTSNAQNNSAHMASFAYGYRAIAAMEWLMQQSK